MSQLQSYYFEREDSYEDTMQMLNEVIQHKNPEVINKNK